MIYTVWGFRAFRVQGAILFAAMAILVILMSIMVICSILYWAHYSGRV